jgi:hypothetical protein
MDQHDTARMEHDTCMIPPFADAAGPSEIAGS